MLTIPTAIYNAVIKHAEAGAPIETCGYFSGKEGVVYTFIPMTNRDNQPDHFSFDPSEQFQAVKQARATGEDLMVVYHSHPVTPARLSEEDLRLFNDPKMIYVIVSLMDSIPKMSAFRIQKSEKEVLIESIPIHLS